MSTAKRTKRLYKFLPAKYGLQAIESGELKVGRFRQLNDPFELLAFDLSNAHLRRSLIKTINEADEVKGIISFSRRWDNPVLWSHYADSHHGIALGFDYDDEITEPTVERIQYSNKRLNPAKLIDSMDRLEEDGWKLLAPCIKTKFKHWIYESESRIVVYLSDCRSNEHEMHFYKFYPKLILKEVIVGCRSHVRRQQILEALEVGRHSIPEPSIPTVFKACPAFKEFKIVRNQNERLWN